MRPHVGSLDGFIPGRWLPPVPAAPRKINNHEHFARLGGSLSGLPAEVDAPATPPEPSTSSWADEDARLFRRGHDHFDVTQALRVCRSGWVEHTKVELVG